MPVTIEQMRALFDEKLEPLMTQITAISVRMDSMETTQATLEANQKQQADQAARLRTRITSLEAAVDRYQRHSFSFDILLHGVAETSNEDWKVSMGLVRAFLQDKGLQQFISKLEGYGHRLGPAQTTLARSLPTGIKRSRPICFRMLSRADQQELVSLCGKNSVSKGAPYLSNHLSKEQVNQIRKKNIQNRRTRSDTELAEKRQCDKTPSMAQTPQ